MTLYIIEKIRWANHWTTGYLFIENYSQELLEMIWIRIPLQDTRSQDIFQCRNSETCYHNTECWLRTRPNLSKTEFLWAAI